MNERPLGVKVVKDPLVYDDKHGTFISFSVVVSRAKDAFTHPMLDQKLRQQKLTGEIGGIAYVIDKKAKTVLMGDFHPLGHPTKKDLLKLGIARHSEQRTLEELIRDYPGWTIDHFLVDQYIQLERRKHLDKMGLWPPSPMPIEERLRIVKKYAEGKTKVV